MSFSTDSTNVLLPTPWSFLTAAPTTASTSHHVELKRSHFREGEVRGAQLARVDECCHRSTCVVSTRWGVPLLKRESWRINSSFFGNSLSASHTRGGLLTLASLDICHTLGISNTKAKPVTLSPYHSLHVGWQCSHIRQLPNRTFQIFNLYKRGSVFSVLTGSITRFHFSKLSWILLKKKTPFVTGAGDSISWTSLSETFLIMCRSTSNLSLLVWMQFSPNYRITMKWHLPHVGIVLSPHDVSLIRAVNLRK
jgi:hypothetical protein